MSGPNPTLILLALMWLLMFGGVGVFIAVGPVLKRQKHRRRRIEQVVRYRGRGAAAAATETARLSKVQSRTRELDKFLAGLMPRREALALRLERTGRPITVTRYLLVCVGVVLAVALLCVFFLGLGLLPAMLLGILAGAALPHLWVGRLVKKRVLRFMTLLPEAIDLMVRALRSGLPISEAIVNAGHEIADPVGIEFRQVESALRLGRELNDVLWDTARRLEVPEFRFFVISLSVQRETGGNLAETLATLGDMLRRRRQMKLKIKALSAEGRASAVVLAVLPFIVAVTMTFTSPAYVGRLFTDPRGLIFCGVGLLLMAIGIFIMAKIIDFEI